MLLLGYDLGSSFVKCALVDAGTGRCIAHAQYPETELSMVSHNPGWAEQDPELWWDCIVKVTQKLLNATDGSVKDNIGAIGISYQMHGLVAVDEKGEVVRPSIIWCDSRAVDFGREAFEDIGREKCLKHLLNSPGNFTASKLKWVKENEPGLYEKIHKVMLPGDFVAMKLSGEIYTSISGLSEGVLWDFHDNRPAGFLMDHYGFSPDLLPDFKGSFAETGRLTSQAAGLLGLKEGIPITYRAGDQPNNALSLNVLEPGEIAATAGTSGVVYGVSSEVTYDPESRVNTFAHVNHADDLTRLGILLCINGTGILNNWVRNNTGWSDYEKMNNEIAGIAAGSDGVVVLPFGNGAERVLGDQNIGCSIHGLNFNRHDKRHIARAAQEGIVFSLVYGLDIMKGLGVAPKSIRAGNANMFLSPVFRQTLSDLTGAPIELYNTSGAEGAALGASIGVGYYTGPKEAFRQLDKRLTVEPKVLDDSLGEAYSKWLNVLKETI